MRAMVSRAIVSRVVVALTVVWATGVCGGGVLAGSSADDAWDGERAMASGEAGQAGAAVCQESTATRHFVVGTVWNQELNDSVHRTMIVKFDGWLATHPDDVFVRLDRIRYADDKEDRARQIAQYKENLEKHPGDSKAQLVYAASLIDVNTPEAISRLKQIPPGDPMAPLVHLELAEIYKWGKFVDRAAAREQLVEYREACPTSLASWQGRTLTDVSTPEMAAKYAAQFRERLKGEHDVFWLTAWNKVWQLEFTAIPVVEHGALRKKIDAEARELRKQNRSDNQQWLVTLKDGFHFAEDEMSAREIEDVILAKYPETFSAKSIRDGRWDKEHPSPKPDATAEQRDVYDRAIIARADETLKKKPADSWALYQRFEAMVGIDLRRGARTKGDAKTGEAPVSSRADYVFSTADIVSFGERLRTAVQGDTNWFLMPPAQFRIAKAYLDRGVGADEVPALLDEGRRRATKRDEMLVSDRWADDMQNSLKFEHEYLIVSSAELLVKAAQLSGKPEMAKAAIEELTSQKIEGKFFPTQVWKIKGQWAELNGKKLDAMFMYRASIDSRTVGSKAPKGQVDEAKEGYERLWKELGGSEDGRQAWITGIADAQVAKDGGWEKPPKELPAWELADLQGKTWKLVDFKGKAILINVWATWCGPCRGEHPTLQKLYDKVKDRSDVQVLTFNIDDSAADVTPYMRENHYTFPVLMAKDLVFELLPEVGVPRNWVVDGEGKWKWEEVGFSGEEGFEKEVMEKMGVK